MVKEINQMVSAGKIGGVVKFLSSFADGDLTITISSYAKLATTMQNQLAVSNLKSIGIYDLKGRIQSFAVADLQGGARVGFYHQGTVHSSHPESGASASAGEWTQTKTFDGFDIAQQYTGPPLASTKLEFIADGQHVGMRLRMPLRGLDYDADGNQITKTFGTLETIKLLDGSSVKRLSNLTGMPINLFVGDAFSVGSKPSYKKMESRSIPQQEAGTWDIETQRIRLEDVAIEKDNYFQAILPIFGSHGYAGAVVALQSDALVHANNRQMITILIGVALGCIALITPIAFIVSGTLVRQVYSVVERLQDIAEGGGDLTKRLEVKSTDEIGQLARWFNAFIENIQNIISGIKKNAIQLNQSSNHLSEVSGLMASNAAQTSERSEVVSYFGASQSVGFKRYHRSRPGRRGR